LQPREHKKFGNPSNKTVQSLQTSLYSPFKGFVFLKEGKIPFKYYWIFKRIHIKVWKFYIMLKEVTL